MPWVLEMVSWTWSDTALPAVPNEVYGVGSKTVRSSRTLRYGTGVRREEAGAKGRGSSAWSIGINGRAEARRTSGEGETTPSWKRGKKRTRRRESGSLGPEQQKRFEERDDDRLAKLAKRLDRRAKDVKNQVDERGGGDQKARPVTTTGRTRWMLRWSGKGCRIPKGGPREETSRNILDTQPVCSFNWDGEQEANEVWDGLGAMCVDGCWAWSDVENQVFG